VRRENFFVPNPTKSSVSSLRGSTGIFFQRWEEVGWRAVVLPLFFFLFFFFLFLSEMIQFGSSPEIKDGELVVFSGLASERHQTFPPPNKLSSFGRFSPPFFLTAAPMAGRWNPFFLGWALGFHPPASFFFFPSRRVIFADLFFFPFFLQGKAATVPSSDVLFFSLLVTRRFCLPFFLVDNHKLDGFFNAIVPSFFFLQAAQKVVLLFSGGNCLVPPPPLSYVVLVRRDCQEGLLPFLDVPRKKRGGVPLPLPFIKRESPPFSILSRLQFARQQSPPPLFDQLMMQKKGCSSPPLGTG